MAGNKTQDEPVGLPRLKRSKESWFDTSQAQSRGVVWDIHPRGPEGVDVEMLGPKKPREWAKGEYHLYGVAHAHIRLSPKGTYRYFSETVVPKKTCPFTGKDLTPRARVDRSIKPAVHAVNKAWVELHRARGYMRMQGAEMLAMELEAMARYVRQYGHDRKVDDGQQRFWDEHHTASQPSWVWGTPLEGEPSTEE